MRRLSLYTPGRPPQYGKERWARYEKLRVAGFNKAEARQLSRAVAPQSQSVVAVMVQARSRVVNQFNKTHALEGLNQRQITSRFSRFVRGWFEKNNLTSLQGRRMPVSKGGKPDLMVWYNRTENRLAEKRGWRKGEKVQVTDPSGKVVSEYYLPAEHVPKRRNKRVTPLHKGKGNVKNQRKRAYRRSKAFGEVLQSGDSPEARKQKRNWIKDLRATAKKEPWRDAQLTAQAKRLGFSGRSLLRTRRTV